MMKSQTRARISGVPLEQLGLCIPANATASVGNRPSGRIGQFVACRLGAFNANDGRLLAAFGVVVEQCDGLAAATHASTAKPNRADSATSSREQHSSDTTSSDSVSPASPGSSLGDHATSFVAKLSRTGKSSGASTNISFTEE